MKLSIALVALTLGVSSAFTVPNSKCRRDTTALNMSSNRRHMISQVSSWALGGALMTAASQPAFAKRPAYLTEPTEEFKESERQRAEFRRAQIILKQRMQELLDKLSAEADDADALVADLTALKSLVTEIGGMPAGIKKDDLVKQVRARKAKGFWPTPVEYAYQSLINEIMFQQSPNKDKDNMNPL